MWEVVMVVSLILCCLLAVVMTLLRLPGTWLIVVAAVLYGWWADWEPFGLFLVCVLVGLGLFGEVVELLASVLTARKAGATHQAAWGGLIGGLLGMVFLSSLVSIPFPLVGTLVGAVIGAFIGCFTGATIVELWICRRVAQGAKVGLFSVVGLALGAAAKLAIAMAMSGLLLTSTVCAQPDSMDTALEAFRTLPAGL